MIAVVQRSREPKERTGLGAGFLRVFAPGVNYATLILCWSVAMAVIYRMWLQHGNFSFRHPEGYKVPRGDFLVLLPVLVVQALVVFGFKRRELATGRYLEFVAYSWLGLLVAIIFNGWVFWPLLSFYDEFIR